MKEHIKMGALIAVANIVGLRAMSCQMRWAIGGDGAMGKPYWNFLAYTEEHNPFSKIFSQIPCFMLAKWCMWMVMETWILCISHMEKLGCLALKRGLLFCLLVFFF